MFLFWTLDYDLIRFIFGSSYLQHVLPYFEPVTTSNMLGWGTFSKREKNASLLLEKSHSNVFTAFFYFWECFFNHHSSARRIWPAELIFHPSMHLCHWTFHLTLTFHPANTHNLNLLKKGEKKHSGIPLLSLLECCHRIPNTAGQHELWVSGSFIVQD